MAAAGGEKQASALRRQAKEPLSWAKPAFAAATGGCTVEVATNDAGEPDTMHPTLIVPAPAEYEHKGVTRPSPLAGRSFRVNVTLSKTYPFEGTDGPDFVFESVPFHPAVGPSGESCIEVDWKPASSLKTLAKTIRDALGRTHGGANPEAAALLDADVAAYEARASAGAASAE